MKTRLEVVEFSLKNIRGIIYRMGGGRAPLAARTALGKTRPVVIVPQTT